MMTLVELQTAQRINCNNQQAQVRVNYVGSVRAVQYTSRLRNIQPVKDLKRDVDILKKLRNPNESYQIHHGVEQRFWRECKDVQKIWKDVDDIPGLDLTKAEHQIYTQRWKDFWKWKNMKGYQPAKIEDVARGVAEVYKDNPDFANRLLAEIIRAGFMIP